MLELDLQNNTPLSLNESAIRLHLERVLDRLKSSAEINATLRRLRSVATVVIEINIVGDEKIKELNNQHRGHNQATDVLSFAHPISEQPEDILALGALVISEATAARQAREAGVTTEQEINSLAGHGLLHLLGYHH